MPHLEAISKRSFQYKRWLSPANYKFAAKDALCPLVMLELNKASVHLPIAFSKFNDDYALVAVLGLEAGTNFLVDASGKWLGDYIPAAYRAYPFVLAKSAEEKEVLCIDADCGLIIEDPSSGEAFFDGNGEPDDKIKAVMEFLGYIASNQEPTKALCKLLSDDGLIEPWPVIMNKDGKEIEVSGLYRINETKFNSIDIQALEKLRNAGALPVIYCQLLSMQNLNRIAKAASPSAPNYQASKELQFDVSNQDGNISFDHL